MTEHLRVCIHEAGHALAAHHFRRRIYAVDVDPEGSGQVHCGEFRAAHRRRIAPKVWDRRCLEEATICLAGPLAEHRVFREKLWDRWTPDLHAAAAWLRKSNLPFQQAAQDALRTAQKLLNEPAGEKGIRRLAHQLLDRGSMTGADVAHVLSLNR